MIPLTNQLLLHSDYIVVSPDSLTKQEAGMCTACGLIGPYSYAPIIGEKLAKEWSLTQAQQEMMSARESMFCAACGCSYRLRRLAGAIIDTVGSEHDNLMACIESGEIKELDIAEINSSGVLHDIIKGHTGIRYSEFGSKDKAIADEDVQALSYDDESFDIVITSDTLEHVPSTEKALNEIFRVLKPGGSHIFTVPLYLDRDTRHRLEFTKKGLVKKMLPDSFHGAGQADYVVWHEFGRDFVNTLERAGFNARYHYVNFSRLDDDISGVIVATKPSPHKMIEGKTRLFRKADRTLDKKVATIMDVLDQEVDIATLNYFPEVNAAWQVNRVASLKRKLALTMDHVSNLEAVLSDTERKLSEQRQYSESLVAMVHSYDQTLAARLDRRLKALFRKAR